MTHPQGIADLLEQVDINQHWLSEAVRREQCWFMPNRHVSQKQVLPLYTDNFTCSSHEYVNCTVTQQPEDQGSKCDICFCPLDGSESIITHKTCNISWHQTCFDTWTEESLQAQGSETVQCLRRDGLVTKPRSNVVDGQGFDLARDYLNYWRNGYSLHFVSGDSELLESLREGNSDVSPTDHMSFNESGNPPPFATLTRQALESHTNTNQTEALQNTTSTNPGALLVRKSNHIHYTIIFTPQQIPTLLKNMSNSFWDPISGQKQDRFTPLRLSQVESTELWYLICTAALYRYTSITSDDLRRFYANTPDNPLISPNRWPYIHLIYTGKSLGKKNPNFRVQIEILERRDTHHGIEVVRLPYDEVRDILSKLDYADVLLDQTNGIEDLERLKLRHQWWLAYGEGRGDSPSDVRFVGW